MITTEQIKALDPKRVIILDTETTGLDPKKDEILSLSIVDLEGTVLFDELVQPVVRKRWPNAQKINGISPAMVKDKQPLSAYSAELRSIFQNADLLVGYNLMFDMDFIYASGLPIPSTKYDGFDVMKGYSVVTGNPLWGKLIDCAEHYGFGNFDAHSSLADAETTRRCFLAMIDDPAFVEGVKQEARKDFISFVLGMNKIFLAVAVLLFLSVPAGLVRGELLVALEGAVLFAICAGYIYFKYQQHLGGKK